jgi:hypothetical protein
MNGIIYCISMKTLQVKSNLLNKPEFKVLLLIIC